MAKTIAITGATGAQGGSVARKLLKSGNWKVRAITRNVESKGAKALAAAGAEVVAANLDDESSLVQAFVGVQATFGVTNFWEQLLQLGPDEAAKYEQSQAFNLASAAAKTQSLEHYIWSTLPGTMAVSGGKHFVPHMESKSQVDQHIRDKYPELAKKTTFLWVALYPSNMADSPFIKPMEVKIQSNPSPVENTSGSYPARPPPSSPAPATSPPTSASTCPPSSATLPARYAFVKTETTTFADMLKIWSKVTGKEAVFVEVDSETFEGIWGAFGREMGTQYGFGVDHGDWEGFGVRLLGERELGIGEGELVGLERCLEGLREKLV